MYLCRIKVLKILVQRYKDAPSPSQRQSFRHLISLLSHFSCSITSSSLQLLQRRTIHIFCALCLSGELVLHFFYLTLTFFLKCVNNFCTFLLVSACVFMHICIYYFLVYSCRAILLMQFTVREQASRWWVFLFLW